MAYGMLPAVPGSRNDATSCYNHVGLSPTDSTIGKLRFCETVLWIRTLPDTANSLKAVVRNNLTYYTLIMYVNVINFDENVFFLLLFFFFFFFISRSIQAKYINTLSTAALKNLLLHYPRTFYLFILTLRSCLRYHLHPSPTPNFCY